MIYESRMFEKGENIQADDRRYKNKKAVKYKNSGQYGLKIWRNNLCLMKILKMQ